MSTRPDLNTYNRQETTMALERYTLHLTTEDGTLLHQTVSFTPAQARDLARRIVATLDNYESKDPDNLRLRSINIYAATISAPEAAHVGQA